MSFHCYLSIFFFEFTRRKQKVSKGACTFCNFFIVCRLLVSTVYTFSPRSSSLSMYDDDDDDSDGDHHDDKNDDVDDNDDDEVDVMSLL